MSTDSLKYIWRFFFKHFLIESFISGGISMENLPLDFVDLDVEMIISLIYLIIYRVKSFLSRIIKMKQAKIHEYGFFIREHWSENDLFLYGLLFRWARE